MEKKITKLPIYLKKVLKKFISIVRGNGVKNCISILRSITREMGYYNKASQTEQSHYAGQGFGTRGMFTDIFGGFKAFIKGIKRAKIYTNDGNEVLLGSIIKNFSGKNINKLLGSADNKKSTIKRVEK